MNKHLAQVLCDTVTDADNDRRALADVANIVKSTLRVIINESAICDWSTEQEQIEFLALASYLKRATGMVEMGARMLEIKARDEAWAVLNGAARPIEELLTLGLGTDAEDFAASYLQLDTLAAAAEQGQEPELEMRLVEASHHHKGRAISLIADARLGRSPGTFLDEASLDARFVRTGWDLITTGAARIRDHVQDWELMCDIDALVDAIDQAQTRYETTYRSAA